MRPDESERQRIAYAVAERLVSGSHGSPVGDQTFAAESSPDQAQEKVSRTAAVGAGLEMPLAFESRPDRQGRLWLGDLTTRTD